jgi:hypothetical protein
MDEQPEKTMYTAKWQPIVIFLRIGNRLECSCGALATIVVGSIPDSDESSSLDDVDVYCQSCFVKAQDAALKDR